MGDCLTHRDGLLTSRCLSGVSKRRHKHSPIMTWLRKRVLRSAPSATASASQQRGRVLSSAGVQLHQDGRYDMPSSHSAAVHVVNAATTTDVSVIAEGNNIHHQSTPVRSDHRSVQDVVNMDLEAQSLTMASVNSISADSVSCSRCLVIVSYNLHYKNKTGISFA